MPNQELTLNDVELFEITSGQNCFVRNINQDKYVSAKSFVIPLLGYKDVENDTIVQNISKDDFIKKIKFLMRGKDLLSKAGYNMNYAPGIIFVEIVSFYNRLDDIFCSANSELLDDIKSSICLGLLGTCRKRRRRYRPS